MEFRIAVVPGDGIGTEIMSSCIEVLSALERRHNTFKLHFDHLEVGAAHYRDHGVDMTDEALATIEGADAILLGAIGLPEIRHADGTEIAPHLRLRDQFGLYAGLRPVKAYPNVPTPLADARAKNIDVMILRESTEGLFASVGKGVVENDSVARETLVITRAVCEPLFDTAFNLARQRKAAGGMGKVTCVDKANVFAAYAFFRKVFDERAANFPDIKTDYRYVDAAALDLVRKPWEFDVMVMENMFGDILSDLGASIVGGMGMAPCAELGPEHGLFQPAHGSAPDIAGQDKANPTAMIISGAMMLEWLAERHGEAACADAARELREAVQQGFTDGSVAPVEYGGKTGTKAYGQTVAGALGGRSG